MNNRKTSKAFTKGGFFYFSLAKNVYCKGLVLLKRNIPFRQKNHLSFLNLGCTKMDYYKDIIYDIESVIETNTTSCGYTHEYNCKKDLEFLDFSFGTSNITVESTPRYS